MRCVRSNFDCDDSAQQTFVVNVIRCPKNLKCVNFHTVMKYDFLLHMYLCFKR